jgi:hypothetical protein
MKPVDRKRFPEVPVSTCVYNNAGLESSFLFDTFFYKHQCLDKQSTIAPDRVNKFEFRNY